MADTTAPKAPAQGLALFDDRPFFERALAYGLQHGMIDQAKLDAIAQEAPKGMVQIARHFGSEFLRPEIELARTRIVNLVSLHLEHSSAGDLRRAAEMLRDHSFLSRSKAGSDMLRALIALPQSSHFGLGGNHAFGDDSAREQLADWSLRSLADYQAELALRQQAARTLEAAYWFADYLGLDAEELESAAPDAEAVVRTALLVLAAKHSEWPDWVAFQKALAVLVKKLATSTAKGTGTAGLSISLPRELPSELKPVAEAARQSLLADLPKIVDSALPARKLFHQTPAFMGRYFWLEDAASEVDAFDRATSAAWNKATGGHDDEGSLLTLFLCIASGSAAKTLLSTKSATSLVRKLRKSGAAPERAEAFIRENAPDQHQRNYLELWQSFWEEAEDCLLSDQVGSLNDALALLRRECNIKD